MRITLCPADDFGCGYYRMRLPALAAKDAGYEDIRTTDDIEETVDTPHGKRYVGVLDTDVIVIQRPSTADVAEAVPQVRALGIAVACDLDDALHAVDPRNAAWPATNGKGIRGAREHYRFIGETLRHVDICTVTTPALGEYAAQFMPRERIMLIPNTVPILSVRSPEIRSRPPLTVGWTGWTATHPGDLSEVRGILPATLRRAGARFEVIGPDDGVRAECGAEPDAATGWLPIDDYRTEISRVDVGIVPLRQSRFNAAKSYLKGLEFAAAGVPFVASPTPEYVRLAEQGVGRIAWKQRDWGRQLRSLLDTPDERRSSAEAARSVILKRHTIERTVHLWVEAWTRAYQHRRSGSLASVGSE